MAKKKILKAPGGTKSRPKHTRASLARLTKRKYSGIRSATEKALRAAGLHNLRVHAMTFTVAPDSVEGPCSPPCPPNYDCKLSSTGQWMCVPDS